MFLVTCGHVSVCLCVLIVLLGESVKLILSYVLYVFVSHTSCDNMSKYSPGWLTSLVLSLFLHPVPTLAWRSSLPSGLTHNTNQNTRAHSLSSSADLRVRVLENAPVVRQWVRLQYMLTHPQSNRKRAVQHVGPHVSYYRDVCVCVCAGVWGIHKDTLESFTPAV